MANHFKMDPMDGQYTKPTYTVDLTKKPEEPVKEATLDDLLPTTQENSVEEAPKEKVVKATAITTGESIKADAVPFDPTTIIPRKEEVDQGAIDVFNALDEAVEREKNKITEFHKELEEKMYEDYIERQDSDNETPVETVVTPATSKDTDKDEDLIYPETSTDSNVTFNVPYDFVIDEVKEEKKEETPIRIKRSVEDIISVTDEEIDADLDDDESSAKENANKKKQEDEMNNLVEDLKVVAKEALKGNSIKRVDLSKFKISSQGTKASTVILRTDTQADSADWVLYDAGKSIAMTGLTGPELIKLDPENSNRNRMNTLKDIYKIIYDHVDDNKKPAFDAWMKQTRYSDLDHIYFALYMATFHGSNFVSYQCPDCKKIFIKDIEFKDMVKFKNDEVKETVHAMMSQDTNNGIIEYNVDLIQVSDKFVFGMRSPSLYNVIMENAGLSDNIIEKYSDLIDTINYIDSVYMIDYTNMELTPVIIPIVKDDPIKTANKRIKTLYDILKKLSSDEFYAIRGYISKLDDRSADVTYVTPEAVCPECESKIPVNEDMNARGLLFLRHHLGAFANM